MLPAFSKMPKKKKTLPTTCYTRRPAFSKMPKKDPAAQLVTQGGLHFLKCQKKDPAAQGGRAKVQG